MNRLTVISLGGGVQSTVMALMAGDGAFGGVPDCANTEDSLLLKHLPSRSAT